MIIPFEHLIIANCSMALGYDFMPPGFFSFNFQFQFSVSIFSFNFQFQFSVSIFSFNPQFHQSLALKRAIWVGVFSLCPVYEYDAIAPILFWSSPVQSLPQQRERERSLWIWCNRTHSILIQSSPIIASADTNSDSVSDSDLLQLSLLEKSIWAMLIDSRMT